MAEIEGIRGTVRRREKKKRKKLDLTMEFLSETGDRMAPIVGYFPSGYDPVAAGDEPDVNVFRNKRKPSRLELVVRPDDCNVEFVGMSYTGEAAMPQLCTYALGVLDKENQTLKILPIAANKILRLEPRIINDFRKPTEVGKEVTIDEKKEHPLAELIHLYGTKKSKMRDEVEKTQFACILSYITHLINFRKVAESNRRRTNPNYTDAMTEFMIPRVVFHRFLSIFLDPVSNVLSSEKNELLICYILILTLYADDFQTYSTDIEKDLAMTAATLKPYFLQLGCKAHKMGSYKKSLMTLPVPLVFQDLKMRVRW